MKDPFLSASTRSFRETPVTRLDAVIGGWSAFRYVRNLSAVRLLAFGAEPGELVLAGTRIVVADARDGEPLRVPWIPPRDDLPGLVRGMDVLREGALLLSSHTDRRTRLWDLASGELAAEWELDAETVRFLDGARFLAWHRKAGAGGPLTVHDVATGRERRVLGEQVFAFATLPDDGVVIATAGRVACVDGLRGEERWSVEWAQAGGHLAASPPGDEVLACPSPLLGGPREVRVLSAADGSTVHSHATPRANPLLAILNDGSYVAAEGPFLERRRLDTGQAVWTQHLRDGISGLAVSPEQWIGFLALPDSIVRLDVRTGAITPPATPTPVRGVALAPGGERVASGGPELRLHDLTDDDPMPPVHSPRIDRVTEIVPLAFAADGRVDVAVYRSGVRGASREIFDLRDARLGPSGIASPMRERSPDGRWVAGSEGAVLLLAPAGEPRVRRLTGHQASYRDYELNDDLGGRRAFTTTVDIGDIVFSPDERLVASAADDATVRVWDTETGETVHVLATGDFLSHPARIRFTPDGRMLVVAWTGGSYLAAYDVARGEKVWEVRDGGGAAAGLAVDPLGRWIARAAVIGPVTLHLPGTGEEQARIDLRSANDFPRDLAFDPDGTRLAVTTAAGVVLVFSLHRPSSSK